MESGISSCELVTVHALMHSRDDVLSFRSEKYLVPVLLSHLQVFLAHHTHSFSRSDDSYCLSLKK